MRSLAPRLAGLALAAALCGSAFAAAAGSAAAAEPAGGSTPTGGEPTPTSGEPGEDVEPFPSPRDPGGVTEPADPAESEAAVESSPGDDGQRLVWLVVASVAVAATVTAFSVLVLFGPPW